jgi:hypothetical protein
MMTIFGRSSFGIFSVLLHEGSIVAESAVRLRTVFNDNFMLQGFSFKIKVDHLVFIAKNY